MKRIVLALMFLFVAGSANAVLDSVGKSTGAHAGTLVLPDSTGWFRYFTSGAAATADSFVVFARNDSGVTAGPDILTVGLWNRAADDIGTLVLSDTVHISRDTVSDAIRWMRPVTGSWLAATAYVVGIINRTNDALTGGCRLSHDGTNASINANYRTVTGLTGTTSPVTGETTTGNPINYVRGIIYGHTVAGDVVRVTLGGVTLGGGTF